MFSPPPFPLSVSLRVSPQCCRGLLLQLHVLLLSYSFQFFLQLLTSRPQLVFSGSEPRVVIVLLLSSGQAAPLQQTGRWLMYHQGQCGVHQQWEHLQEHTADKSGPHTSGDSEGSWKTPHGGCQLSWFQPLPDAQQWKRAPDPRQSQCVLCHEHFCQLWLCAASALEEPREKSGLLLQSWSSTQEPPSQVKSISPGWMLGVYVEVRGAAHLQRQPNHKSVAICNCSSPRGCCCAAGPSRSAIEAPEKPQGYDWKIRLRSSDQGIVFHENSSRITLDCLKSNARREKCPGTQNRNTKKKSGFCVLIFFSIIWNINIFG